MKNSANYTETGIWVMYLRKSRADNPEESVEEVLKKHEGILQEWAKRELGYEIPDDDIYREIVSGESLDERVEALKLLARIEDPAVEGVVVVEPQRLSRGDLEDCGRLISTLRYSKTLVATPTMTYDLENKMERRFFQDELLRGRDYLEYVKEVLQRGRIAAIKRGCYIGTRSPYGFKKIMLGKDHSLEPDPDQAPIVQLIFSWYTEELLTPGQIAGRLNERGLPAPLGGAWTKDTIRQIIRNAHYAGKVFYNKIKQVTVMEHGERKTKRLTQGSDVYIEAEGLHEALITPEVWERAKELVARNPRVKHEYDLRNPLSGVLVCAKCGRAMHIHPYPKAVNRYECRQKPRCFKSVKVPFLMGAVITALEEAELPALQAKLKNDDGNSAKIQQKILEQLGKQMQELKIQEDKQYELLETGVYTQDLFERRHGALRARIEECQTQIYQTKANMPKAVDYEERIVALQDAIAALKDDTLAPKDKNRVVRAIVERIEYTGPESDGQNKKRQTRKGVDPFSLKVFLRL